MNTTLSLYAFGAVFVILGSALLLHRKAYYTMIQDIASHPSLLMIISMWNLMLGLIMVNMYRDWSTIVDGILSTIALLVFVKGMVGLVMPQLTLWTLQHIKHSYSYITFSGIITILGGLAMTGLGLLGG